MYGLRSKPRPAEARSDIRARSMQGEHPTESQVLKAVSLSLAHSSHFRGSLEVCFWLRGVGARLWCLASPDETRRRRKCSQMTGIERLVVFVSVPHRCIFQIRSRCDIRPSFDVT